ncbi:hypothetical protein J008_02502 [Cryptococcus neoformans]|nr:hypothetical protein J008_02502 [Cryptococcus neoformans var. grubii]
MPLKASHSINNLFSIVQKLSPRKLKNRPSSWWISTPRTSSSSISPLDSASIGPHKDRGPRKQAGQLLVQNQVVFALLFAEYISKEALYPCLLVNSYFYERASFHLYQEITLGGPRDPLTGLKAADIQTQSISTFSKFHLLQLTSRVILFTHDASSCAQRYREAVTCEALPNLEIVEQAEHAWPNNNTNTPNNPFAAADTCQSDRCHAHAICSCATSFVARRIEYFNGQITRHPNIPHVQYRQLQRMTLKLHADDAKMIYFSFSDFDQPIEEANLFIWDEWRGFDELWTKMLPEKIERNEWKYHIRAVWNAWLDVVAQKDWRLVEDVLRDFLNAFYKPTPMPIPEEGPFKKKRIRIYNMTTYMRHQILLSEGSGLTFDKILNGLPKVLEEVVQINRGQIDEVELSLHTAREFYNSGLVSNKWDHNEKVYYCRFVVPSPRLVELRRRTSEFTKLREWMLEPLSESAMLTIVESFADGVSWSNCFTRRVG